MAKKKPAVIEKFVKQIERNAKQLRKDVKRFSKNTDLPHNLDELAGELRRGAATLASEIEHYLHEVRSGLQQPRDKAGKKTAKKATASRKKKTTKRATSARKKASNTKTTVRGAKKRASSTRAKKATRKRAARARA